MATKKTTKKTKDFLPANKRPPLIWGSVALGFLILAVLTQFVVLNFKATKTISPNIIHKLVTSPSAHLKPSKAATPSAKLTSASSSATQDLIPYTSGKSVSVPILMYHYIGNNPNPADKARDILSTAPDKFDAQLGYLASKGYTPITFDTMYAAMEGKAALPPKPIILTFDDGYIDFYVNAFPILRKYNFHAVSFIPTGLMNQGYYLSWTQIKEMQSSGLISFEAHSVNHVNLVALNPDQVKYQVFESKKILESQIGAPVNFFAYPYGPNNDLDRAVVKQAGFLGAVGTWYGRTESEGTEYDWPRIRISGGISLQDFAAKL